MNASVQEIEQAVSRLPAKELAVFRHWFQEFDAQLWDEQFERDATAGKLDKLVSQSWPAVSRNRS